MSNESYNPDVLSCLANLSNDEVFTPPNVVNEMLDMLPADIWSDKSATFLDPFTKSGVFLREIAKRLIVGLENEIPNLQERLDHIFHNQIFGIAITELTSLLSRRSLYCSKYPNCRFSVSKFNNTEGNIRYRRLEHTWRDGKCIYCGAAKEEYDRGVDLESHAYELIHTNHPERIFNMKFDVIIGNPPYQLTTNAEDRIAAKQAKPLFHEFVINAQKLNPRFLSMIIPARWYSGGIGLGDFREKMLSDKRITKLVDYPNSKDCFDGVDIAGGVCYFLWSRDEKGPCEVKNIIGQKENFSTRYLDEFGDLFVRSNEAISIIHKVRKKCDKFLENKVYALDPFGIPTAARGKEKPFAGCISLIHSQGVGFISPAEVKKNKELINKWKVTIARIVPCNGEVGIDPEKGYRSITNPRILKPGEVNTFSYVLLGTFNSEAEAINYRKYLMCKLPRFLLRLTYSSMNIAKTNFKFVPELDFNEEWSPKKLYELFDLDEEEISLVEKTMRDFDEKEEDESNE